MDLVSSNVESELSPPMPELSSPPGRRTKHRGDATPPPAKAGRARVNKYMQSKAAGERFGLEPESLE
jgi:hypothetical protein